MPAFLPSLLLNPRFRQLCIVSALVMYVLIITTGNIPGARADIGHIAPGPVLHSTAYAVLAALWFCGSTGSAAARAGKAVLAVAVMGALDEIIQSFFPYRGASVRDWAVDAAAAIVATLLLGWLARRAAVDLNR